MVDDKDERMSEEDAKALLVACQHELSFAFGPDGCDCEYCKGERSSAVWMARSIKAQLLALGWEAPSGKVMQPKTLTQGKDGWNATF